MGWSVAGSSSTTSRVVGRGWRPSSKGRAQPRARIVISWSSGGLLLVPEQKTSAPLPSSRPLVALLVAQGAGLRVHRHVVAALLGDDLAGRPIFAARRALC